MKKRKKGAASDRGFNSVMMVWLCVTLFILLFPIFAIILMSFNTSKYGALPFEFTLKWYKQLFQSADLLSATWYSLWFSILVSTSAAVLGITASMALRRMSRKWNKAFPTLMNVPVIIPWLVQAVAAVQSAGYRQVLCKPVLRLSGGSHAAFLPDYLLPHYDHG